jgi:ParB family chromosome partitioning protein
MNRNQEPPRRALGKGLSALLPPRTPPNATITIKAPPEGSSVAQGVAEIPTDLIDPNPLQPRTIFEPEKLAELAQSIRSNGIIQPLVVQKSGDRYQLVAGERRWRAAKLAGMDHVPVVVREFATDRMLEIALIENIQREDLNPIEVAQALERLGKELKLSHEQIGERTGKDRTTVTNLLRLLRLPSEVQVLLAERRLSTGHAKVIAGLPNEELQLFAAQKAAEAAMSVRQIEKLVQSLLKQKSEKDLGLPEDLGRGDPNVNAAGRELESVLGTRVRIIPTNRERGRIEIEYYTAEDLDRIYNLITGGSR